MTIEVFAVCEAAEDQQGRLSLFGTYERISVSQLPLKLSGSTIVLRLRFESTEGGCHQGCLHCLGPDGYSVMEPIVCSCEISFPPGAVSATCNLLLSLPGLNLREYGEHSFDFYLEGELLAQLPLLIAEPAPRKMAEFSP